ncbi:hypothetical protein TNCV_2164671 [Trichonephila clavipes]|nr:hypothetical protein TNCV_2164671 [Trichonephila clavipes]
MEKGSEINFQIWKWEIVNPDDSDQDKGSEVKGEKFDKKRKNTTEKVVIFLTEMKFDKKIYSEIREYDFETAQGGK